MLKKLFRYSQFRYLLSGGTAFIIEYGCFAVTLSLTNGLIFSNSVSFIIGTLAGFMFHKFWTFAGDHRFRTSWQTTAVFLVAAFNLVFTNILISLLVDSLSTPPHVAKIVVIVIIVIWNYLLFNYLIFRRKPKSY